MQNALKFWNLGDIVRHFKAREFASLFSDLMHYWWFASRSDEDEEIPVTLVPVLKDLGRRSEALTKELEMKISHRRACGPFLLEIRSPRPRWGRLKMQIEALLETLQTEIEPRRFASISPTKSGFLESIMYDNPESNPSLPDKKPDEIWLRIWRSFPSLHEESEEAVYCYVLERNTACVFHSMRIAEIGLRALAHRMRVRLPKGKRIEWAQWQEVLREIRKKIDAMGQNGKPGKAKDKLLDFYNGAYGQFMGFKDEFRNAVMHVRDSYDEYQAASALTRVRDFMGKLASEIDENGKKVRTK